MSRRFILYALLGLALGALVVLTPFFVERAAGQAALRIADDRGWTLEWRELDWSWGRTLEVDGVTFALGRVSGSAERVEITVDPSTILEARPGIEAVRVVGLDAAVDLAEGGGAEPQSADGPSAGPAAGRLRRVALVSGRISLQRGQAALAVVEVDEAMVGEPGADGAQPLEGRGRLRPVRRDVARLMAPSIEWRANGEVRLGARTGRVRIESSRDGEPLVEPVAGDLGAVGVRAIALERSSESLAVVLDAPSGQLGGMQAPAARAHAERLRLAVTPAREVSVAIEAPTLTVAPRRLTTLVAAMRRAGEGGEGGAAEDDAGAAGGEAGASELGGRLIALLDDLDVSVDRGTLELVLGDESQTTLTLVEGLDARYGDDELQATGRSAGGQFELSASLVGGLAVPRTVAVAITGADLEALPWVREGRTLPSRGIRGRIGGRVDLAGVVTVQPGVLTGRPDAGIVATVEGAWHDGLVSLAGLADEPLTQIEAGARLELGYWPRLGRLELLDGQATYGPMVVDLAASAEGWPYETTVAVEAGLREIGCQEAVRALPPELLGPYRAIEIEGRAAPSLRARLPLHSPDRLTIGVDGFEDRCHVTALNADEAAWPELRFQRRPVPGATEGDLGQLLYGGTTPKPPAPIEPPDELDDVAWLNLPFVKRVTEGVSDEAVVEVGPGLASYVPLDELPASVGAAAYLSEEMGFWDNHALDLALIQKALRINLRDGRFVYGGSTVTQQLIKNLFLSRHKTLARKLQEALIGWRIEDAVTKARVLELYVNCIEYAQDVYGVGPAAEHYFGKDARQLTPKEAVFLAILKPAPWYGDRFRKRGSTPTKGWWFDRMGEIFGRLVDKGYLTAEEAEAQKPYILRWDEKGRYLAEEPGEAESSTEHQGPSTAHQ